MNGKLDCSVDSVDFKQLEDGEPRAHLIHLITFEHVNYDLLCRTALLEFWESVPDAMGPKDGNTRQ